MKKLASIAALFLLAVSAFGQPCSPDLTLTKPGIKPTDLPDGIVGKPYSEVISLLVPLDTVVTFNGNPYNVRVDSSSVIYLSDFPATFGYECDKVSRTWLGGQRGCARFFGNPTASMVGTYKIWVKTRTFFKIIGLSNAFDQVDSSYVTFHIVQPNAVKESMRPLNVRVYPNPANNVLNVQPENFNAPATYTIYNILGQNFETEKTLSPNTGEVKINISQFNPGVYFIKCESMGKTFVTRFIKE